MLKIEHLLINNQNKTTPLKIKYRKTVAENKISAFTLAEMLIALAVIGIVAALTLPTLMTTISDKIKENQISVFERKISKGTDLLNIENGIGPYYTSSTPSYEFAQALSKHLKIATICDKNNLKKCFNYDYIQTDMGDKNITDIKTGEDLQLNKNDYTDVAGIVLGDGTPMIFSWNKNCPVSDPDSVNKGQTTACIQGIYDLNGSKGPNKFGKDIVGFNAGHLGWIDVAGMKISAPFVATPLNTRDYCTQDEEGEWQINALGSKLGIKKCCTLSYCVSEVSGRGDRYAGAMKACYDMGATVLAGDESLKIAKYIYDVGENDNFNSKSQNGLTMNTSKLMPLTSLGTSFYIWIMSESETQYRSFKSTSTAIGSNHDVRSSQYGASVKTVCVKK